MKIEHVDGRARITLESYADLLQLRTISEYQFVDDNIAECEPSSLAAAGLAEQAVAVDIGAPSEFLFDYQQWLVAMAVEKERFAVFSTTGTGKALASDTLIMTPTGMVAISDLRVGDEVIGSDGHSTEVLGVFPQGIRTAYEVTFSDEASIVCDDEHLWAVRSKSQKFHGRGFQVMTLRDIRAHGLGGLGTSRQERKFIPMVEPVHFDEMELPLHPYLLGCLIGDGCITGGTPQISSADDDLIDHLREVMPLGTVIEKKRYSRYDYDLVRSGRLAGRQGGHHPNPVTVALTELGLWGHGAESKFIPDCYKYAAADTRLLVIQGMMDTDGSTWKTHNSSALEYCTVSKRLAEDFVFMVQSLGGKGRIRTKPTNRRLAYRVIPALPSEVVPFLLKRKADLFQKRTKYMPARSIRTVAPIGERDMTCIKVAAIDGLFVTDGFIVTHNTPIQLDWARLVTDQHKGRTLIVAPLAVVPQTISEDAKFYGDSLPIVDLRDRAVLNEWLESGSGIGITNFDKIDRTPDRLNVQAVVIDESSALKNNMGQRRTSLIRAFKGVRWKLCCSATPAPNDRMEYAEHAYFLDVVRSTREFLAAYFVNRDGNWELKRHGLDAFYRHLASWSVFMLDPKEFRFDHDADLPPLNITYPPIGATVEQMERSRSFESGGEPSLFGVNVGGITSRIKMAQIANGFVYEDGKVSARFPADKPQFVAAQCNEVYPDEQVIVWVTFDEEGDNLERLIPGAVHLSGKTPRPKRDATIDEFRQGLGPRVLLLKPAQFSFGLNLQACRIQIFSSITDSWERLHQCIRRSWRFGQERPVEVIIPLTPFDDAVATNLGSKQSLYDQDSQRMQAAFVAALRPLDSTERRTQVSIPSAELDRTEGEGWTLIHGDCIAHMPTMREHSMDFAVFSPPFANLFTYSSALGDMGNVKSDVEYRLQWKWFAEHLVRVMKPGRNVAIHAMDIIRFAGQHGVRHTYDYPSDLAAGMRDAGFLYRARITIHKDPQVQAVRTKDANLLFVTLKRNALDSHPQAQECVLLFTAPGEPETPVLAPDVTNVEWIEWAHSVWFGIREMDVLNAALGKEHEDERHICLARGSLVLTRGGYRPIQEIVAGELVLTHKGRWMPVLAVECTGVRPVVTLRAQGVPGLTLTPDHKLWTRVVGDAGARHHREVAKAGEPQWVEARDCERSYINLKLPEVETPAITDLDHWWVVGRWLADGHFETHGPGALLSCGAHEVDDLARRLGRYGGNPFHATGTALQVLLRDRSGELRRTLKECGRGAAGKHLPPDAYTLPVAQARALLEGYLSGDGHYRDDRQRWMASSRSKELLLGVAMLAQRVHGSIASVYAGRPAGEAVIQGRTVHVRQDWILSFDVPDATRANGLPFILDDGAWKKVRSVESIGEVETWNLRVAEDESFTAEGCIVKNCPLQLPLIERCVRLWTNPGEMVFSPFGGIGSEGVRSLEWGRKAYLVELKRSYFDTAARNLHDAEIRASSKLDFGPIAADS